MIYLLDSNVLIARASADHEHHAAAMSWLSKYSDFAMCPITEGALVRAILRSPGGSGTLASQSLATLSKLRGYHFWPADLPYTHAPLHRLRGHKQVTDTYLVALAVAHGGRLATFDQGLVADNPEAVLLPAV